MKAALVIAALCFVFLFGCGKDDKPDLTKNVSAEPDTIKYYRTIMDTTRNASMQKNAHFMICYLYFHNTKDKQGALKNMKEFLKKYPENDSAGTTESVQIMLDMVEGKRK